jgi:hypothetical protein
MALCVYVFSTGPETTLLYVLLELRKHHLTLVTYMLLMRAVRDS